MSVYVLIFITLLPSGSLSVRASSETMYGADLCLTRKAELETVLEAKKLKGQLGGYTVECVNSKMVPGAPV